MSIRKTVLVAWNDIRISVCGNVGASLFNLLLFPLGIAYVMGVVFDGGFGRDAGPEIVIDVLDHDQSAQSLQFLDMLRAINTELVLCPMDAFTSEDTSDDRCDVDREPELTLAASERRFDTGLVQAVLEIPAGFGSSLLSGEPTAIALYPEVEWTQPNGYYRAVETAVRRLGEAAIAAQVGEQVFAESLDFATDDAAAQFRATVFHNAAVYLTDPQVRIAARSANVQKGAFNVPGFAQTVPGFGCFFTMMTLLAGAALLVQERDNHTWRRQLTMPVRRVELLGGKILGRFVMGIFQFGLILVAGALFGMSYQGIILPLILLMGAFVLCITALTFFLATAINIRTERQAQGMQLLVAFTLAGLGGAFVPLDIMPETLRQLAHLSPVAWAMDGFNALFFAGGGLAEVRAPLLVLSAASVVLFTMSVPRFKWE